MKIINIQDGLDYKNFEYAICSCLSLQEGIQIKRPKYDNFIHFNCPRCNRELGIFVRGKNN